MKSYPILIVSSGKGGVGKSTISFCISKLLAELNYKVGLIDGDIYGPSLHLFFSDLGSNKPLHYDQTIIPPLIEGIKFISSAFYAPGGAFIRAPKASGMLKSFFEQADWGELDLLIVDMPPGTGDLAVSLFQDIKIDGAFVVTTPHTLSVEDAAKATSQIIQSGIPCLGFIENMSYFQTAEKREYLFGQGGGKELSELFCLPLLTQIPILSRDQILSIQSCLSGVIASIQNNLFNCKQATKCCK